MNSLLGVLVVGALFGVYYATAQDQALMDQKHSTEARNKKIAMAFAQEFMGDKNIEAADKYVSPNVIIHNPLVADGRESLKTVAKTWFQDSQKEKVDIRRISADGDLVWLHYKSVFLGKDSAIVDIYRFENGKIAEYWDVIQPIPEKSANNHPLF